MTKERLRLRRDNRDKIAMPCETCRARDNRDAAHAQGCPQVARLPKEELVRIARRVEAAWMALEARRQARREAKRRRSHHADPS